MKTQMSRTQEERNALDISQTIVLICISLTGKKQRTLMELKNKNASAIFFNHQLFEIHFHCSVRLNTLSIIEIEEILCQ